MQKEIGSNFWLDINSIDSSTWNSDINLNFFRSVGKDKTLFLSSGRSAIRYALQDVKNSEETSSLKAVIPPYTCDTVLQPFIDEGFDVYTYDIKDDLNVNLKKFSSLLRHIEPTVVFFHSYFGFNTAKGLQDIIKDCKNHGIRFIEDRTQNLFSDFQPLDVDYIVGSFRKWDAIPDGGYCIKTIEEVNSLGKPYKEDETLIRSKLGAFQLKNEYMSKGVGQKETFLKAYEEAERILDAETEFYSMSNVSKMILNNLNIGYLIESRRRNYSYVFEYIKCDSLTCLTGCLPNDVVPLYFVIRSKKRDDIQSLLRNNDIYAPIVWPKPRMMPPVSDIVDDIYHQVLCLPIDQRYGLDDMERMVNVINSFY